MYYRLASLYRRLARARRSAEDLIKFVSTDVYNRIGFVKKNSPTNFLRVYEVTLTQNIVYEILKFQEETGTRLVDLYESKQEPVNGADLLLGMQVGTGYLKIPIQAKILKPYKAAKDGSYPAFHHSNKTSGSQRQLLIDFAVSCGSKLPLYMLYNYTVQSPHINPTEQEHLYGCSCFSAHTLPGVTATAKTVKFSHLHPAPGIPWYHMFTPASSGAGGGGQGGGGPQGDGPENDPNNDVREFYARFGIDTDEAFIAGLEFYTHEELTAETDEWERISLQDFDAKSENSQVSRPYYKMVFLPQPNRLAGAGGNSFYIDDAAGSEEIEVHFLETGAPVHS